MADYKDTNDDKAKKCEAWFNNLHERSQEPAEKLAILERRFYDDIAYLEMLIGELDKMIGGING